MSLRTPLCDLLGTEHPIMLAGMGGVSYAELAAAMCEAGGFGEGALTPQSGWAWREPGPEVADAKTEVLLGRGLVERLAETSYRTGDVLTGSNTRLKLANIADRLALRAAPTMLLILSAERPAGDTAGRAPAESIAAFRAATGPLGPWMDRIGRLR